MEYVSREDVDRAGGTDLLSYLRECEPDKLVKVSSGTYCTSQHDSLRISNGKWYWFSKGIGGTNALKYLMVVEGYPMPQAVRMILGNAPEKKFAANTVSVPKASKELRLPPKAEEPYRAVRYLRDRGIHPDVIRHCLDRDLMYESADRHHNVVFVGYGEEGRASYAAVRSTSGPFKGDAAGSDKSYPFSLTPEGTSRHLHVFEAAIDLLSYATLERMAGRDWRRDHMVSLGGVTGGDRIPAALEKYLGARPGIETVHLHLDADAAGRSASRSIIKALSGRYSVVDEPPLRGKDYNDYLMEKKRLRERRYTELSR